MKFNKLIVIIVAIIFGIGLEGCDCKVVQFIFGDSLSDVGNNRHLTRSLAQANLPWYGIDMGNGLPNGRFSNGRTVADIIGDSLGLPRPPPVLDTSLTEKDILINGLNYASGGGGILNETGTYFIEKLSLDKQIELFQGTQELIRSKIGKRAADKFFKEAQYVVALGSNDFINNYLMPLYTDSWTYNDETFMDYLIGTLRRQLKVLHGLGARQLMVFGLGPMGCIPLQRVLTTTGNCREKVNKLALSFNKASSELIDDLVKQLPNSNYRFGDAYDVVSDLISNPLKYGFQNADSPCCSFGRIRPALTCVPASTLCSDRSKYVFWDEYHPSDSANELIANELIKKFGLSSTGQNAAPSPAPVKQELNGSVVSGSEKHDKKDKKKKIEFGDIEGDGNVPKKEEDGIELGRGGEGGTEEGKKQKKEKKNKKKDKNLEVENAKEQEQQKEVEKNVKVENGGLVAPQDLEIRSKMRNETGSEKLKLQSDKNSEVENAKGQEQQKEVGKKLSNGVKSENGGSIGSQDIEIRSKKKHKAGTENKLDAEEVSTEKKKRRKNQDLEERSEERSGERSKKKMKRKHEG